MPSPCIANPANISIIFQVQKCELWAIFVRNLLIFRCYWPHQTTLDHCRRQVAVAKILSIIRCAGWQGSRTEGTMRRQVRRCCAAED